ncbi:MAG TPA: hypothetical protein VKU60_10600 [Chloroflexota bacterium]|nr:hypothetical protein [Chloroflexota bacterium]
MPAPWYKSDAAAILGLFLCPPVGVALVWLYQKWDGLVKMVVSLVSLSGLVAVLMVVAGSGGNEAAAGPALDAGAPAALQTAGTQDADSLDPRQVVGRAAGSLVAAAQRLTGDVTEAPPQTSPAAPQAPVIRAQSTSSQPGLSSPAGNASAAAAAAAPANAAPQQAAARSSAAAVAPANAPAAAPPVAVAAAPTGSLTAAQKQTIQTTLLASTTHYSQLLDAGKGALGSKRYADASEVADAQDDPSSPAGKFSHWRDQSKVDDDQSYGDAYDQVTAIYADAGVDAPDGLDVWLATMTDMQSSIVDWADAAVDWEGQDDTDAELAAAEKTVRDDLNDAKTVAQKLQAS